MATLSTAKTLGGVGAILVLIPFVSLVGYILIIVAIKDIADALSDRSIFNNVVIGAVTGIVGAIAGAFIIVFGALGAMLTAGVSAFFGVITGLLVAWVFLIVSAVFFKKSYDTMAEKLGVGWFRTAATLYLVGAALTIVFVGFIVLLVAEILQAVAYFSIPDTTGAPPAQPSMGPSVPQTPPPPGMKICSNCGARISSTATFCSNCGAKQA